MNILWDFDGTIFNTYPAYSKIVKKVLNDQVSEEEIYKQLKVSFSHAFHYFGFSNEQEKYIRQQTRKIKPSDFIPFNGVRDVLERAHLNVIMTHKEREDVLSILKFHGFDHLFKDVVAGDDGFPRKPDSTSYKYLHEKYVIDLAIGDRELDILPAKELGIKTCLFQNDTKGADFYLNDYRDFDNLVKKKMK